MPAQHGPDRPDGPLPSEWLILADDLTGAADCAIAFARRGLGAAVGWHAAPAGDGAMAAFPVLAIDADSRRLLPEAAAARHAALLRRHLSGRAHPALIKKIDSTLRGQPAAELAATLAALREMGRGRLALLAPAFPATGRTTEGGHVHLEGVRLDSTALWARDHSYDSADLLVVLASAGLKARLLPLERVRKQPSALAAALHAAHAERLDALVCDAVEVADLDNLARASLPLAENVLWVGSGGIAAALAAALPAATGVPPPALPRRPGGVLVVVGSVAEASRAAAAALAGTGVPRFAIPAELLRAGEGDPRWRPLGREIAAAIAAGRDTLVEIAADPAAELRQGAALAEALALLLAPAASRMGGLFATGGETACALLSRLGVHGIHLLEEVEPGVPLGLTLGALQVPVMTKAGAFGRNTTILRSLARLHHLLGAPS
ncbi:four-carbon acid sugar kinase family protein [Teichococcus oryzae]|uniref:Four-carbon acid sugar kinase family protein n=1 Tax=Teichococcus oryzae TaxID=1608942 RepID=A0A5B2THA5_9PROT|nr:four-carbon acid sugar kinase family protein [Pseudoroseomonas oryzae]KAA2213375.1 four-carbon acid sugar kinase family protein [Pseudoroseomonas oryzae]